MKAPWPQLRVDDSWDPSEGLSLGAERDQRISDGEATARLETRRRVARDCAAAGLPIDDFYRRLDELVLERFLRHPWSTTPERVYVARQWTEGAKYWSLALEGTTLMYPPVGWGRHVNLDTHRDSLELFVEPKESRELDVRIDVLVGEPLRGILRSAIHGGPWVFVMLDLVRARQLPDLRGEQLERMRVKPQDASDWRVYVHPDGRVWAIRASQKGYQLRLGAPDDDPVFKERPGTATEITKLIAAQLADGFEPTS